MAVFSKKWVRRSQPCFVFCACVFEKKKKKKEKVLFPERCISAAEQLERYLRFESHARRSKCSRRARREAIFFFPREATTCSDTAPSLPLHKARISSTQRPCLLSEVTAGPLTPTPQLSDHPTRPASFPSPPRLLFFFLLSFSVCIERKKHMFPSEGRHIKHKLFLVNGWALFQGQSETLSGRQRARRALAPAQVCTEYI